MTFARSVRGEWLALVAIASLTIGCSEGAPIVSLDRWTVVEAGTSAPRDVRLPVHFTRDEIPDSIGEYAMRTTVHLSRETRGRELWFVVAQLPTRTSLVVDGREAPEVLSKPWDFSWSSGPQIFEIPPEATLDGVLHVEWRIANHWPFGRWHDRAPELRRPGTFGRSARITQVSSVYIAAILVGGLIAVAFSCAAAMLVDRGEPLYRRFFLVAIFALPFGLFQMGLLQAFVSIRFEFATMMITFFLAVASLAEAIVDRWELGTPRWIAVPWLFVLILVTIALRRSPHISFTVVCALGAIASTHTLVLPFLAMVRGRGRLDVPGRQVMAYVLVFALTVGLPDIAFFSGYGDHFGGGHATMFGVLAVAIGVVLLLARKRTDELTIANESLGHRADELRDERTRLGVLEAELDEQMSRGQERLLEAIAAMSSGASPRPELREGDLVDDRYRIVRTLGIGGMGAVYEVVRLSDESRFALKIAHELDGTSLARLAREALIGANVRSESIIDVVDLAIAPEGYLFLVMELFEGRPLAEWSSRYGDVEWALPILTRIARGVAVLHAARIVHRDLKPSNVLVGAGDPPAVKIADFGISRFATEEEDVTVTGEISRERITDRPAARTESPEPPENGPGPESTSTVNSLPELTVAGAIAGTAAYMAPELTYGEAPTTAADVFAFGVIAYQILAGERPFETARDLMPGAGADAVRLPDLVARIHDVDRHVLELFDACRAVDPADRPSMSEVARSLIDEPIARRRDMVRA